MPTVPRQLRERRVFVASSAYLALLDEDDDHYSEAVAVLNRLADQRFRQIPTNIVLIEAHALILSNLGIRRASQFLRDMGDSSTVVVRGRASDEYRAKQILFQYADKDFSFTDAISFALMERLRIPYAFTFERHFAHYGFESIRA